MNSVDSLEYLFNPDRIAFIGASENSERFISIYENLTEFGGDHRDLYFVNPNQEQVFGQKSYDTVLDVPEDIDLAIIIVPASVVLPVFKECCEAGVRNAVIVSAKFGESGAEGKQRKQQLVELSQEYELPFCGPNTYGALSTYDEMAPIQASTLEFDSGNVSAVLQSGGLLNQLLYSSLERGFGFSKVVDSGNEASITASDYIDHMLDDEHTDVIIGLIEGFNDPKRFLEVSERAVELGKPVIILKIARSEKGGEIAQSHTGSITAQDDVVTAALKQHGTIQVASLDMLIETAELFSKVTQISGNNVGVIEISGGGCALFSDAIDETGLEIPSLSSTATDAVEEHLPSIGVARNPVDMAMGWSADAMDSAHPGVLDALDEYSDVDIIISRLSIPQDGAIDTAKARLEDIKHKEEKSDTTFAVITRASGRVSDEWVAEVKETNIPFMQEYHKGIRALDHLWTYSSFTANVDDRTRSDPELDPIDYSGESVISEYEAKQILTKHGLRTPQEQVATSEQDAVDFASSIGYPVSLKVLSPDIPHKTDIGGVAIDIESEKEVRNKYNEILNAVEESCPDADLQGILVQEMIEDGVEVLIGSNRSPFGQAVVVGLGGIFTETLDDTTIRIAPFTPKEATEMLCELQGYDVLAGERGHSSMAISELAGTISRFSEFIAANGSISEADLNPVIVTDEDAYIVDALFHVSPD